MSHFAPKFAALLFALTLTISGVTLGATRSAPTLSGPIAPFGCGA
jgi:hypothetical protein